MFIRFIYLGFILLLVGTYFLLSPALKPHIEGTAKIGGEFTLTDTHGQHVKESDFRGHLMLVYMGYSHCPDICPMTLQTMGEALKILGNDADKIAVLFISLDPERDTPKVLGEYLRSFDSRIIGLTGSKEEIAHAAQVYRIYYKKESVPDNNNYMIDHSGFLYLMDAQGKYIAHFDTTVKADALAQTLRQNF